jgi:hypothetical protein
MMQPPTSKYPEPESVMWIPRNADVHFKAVLDMGQLAASMLVPFRVPTSEYGGSEIQLVNLRATETDVDVPIHVRV